MPASPRSAPTASALLARGGVGVFALRLGAVVLGLALQIGLTRSLGKEGYGLLAVVLSWAGILVALAGLGMDTTLVRFLPSYPPQKKWGLFRGMLGWTARVMGTGGVLAGGVLALWAWQLPLDSPWRPILWVTAALIPVQLLAMHQQSVLRGIKNPVRSLVPDQIVRPLVSGGLLAALLLTGGVVQPVHGAWVILGGFVVSLFWSFWTVRRHLPLEAKMADPATEPQVWRGVAGPLLWITLMNIGINRLDPAMVGWLDDPASAGLYAVASRASDLLLFGLAAVNAVAAPLISELYVQGKREELQNMLCLAARGIALFTLPAAAFLLFFGEWMLAWFGSEFVEARPAMVWLIGGQCINALAGSVGFLLTMTGHQKVAARILTLCAALKIGANLVLIPLYGEIGAAISAAAMVALWNILLYREVRRRLDFEPTILALFRSPSAESP